MSPAFQESKSQRLPVPTPFPMRPDLRDRIRLSLYEDLGDEGDVTSNTVFAPDHRSTAEIIAKQEGIAAGLPLIPMIFAQLDPTVGVELLVKDGAKVTPGLMVAKLEGPTRTLLSGERLALNFLQHLSGIATMTSVFVAASNGKVAICDTRKTTPLWRDLEKYAVAIGGGTNHRFGLFDMAMLKDTHADGSGGLARALERMRRLRPGIRIAAEARSLDEVKTALEHGVDLLMLDNMDEKTLRAAIAFVDHRVPLEITGGVTLAKIAELALLGVDRVSIGALTHSVTAMDFSMRIHLEGEGPLEL